MLRLGVRTEREPAGILPDLQSGSTPDLDPDLEDILDLVVEGRSGTLWCEFLVLIRIEFDFALSTMELK